jgi:PAS domain S-box-containing protein
MIPKNPRVISTVLIILIILITSVTVYSISMETRQTLKEAVQGKLVAVASATASQIDGDTFAAIRPGDEGTTGYTRLRDQIRAVKESVPDIRYIYTLRKNGDSVAFVVDADYGHTADAVSIGVLYPEAEAELFQGFVAPTADNDFTTDQWGTVLSGFAPIRDHAGNVVGIVGVDMDSSVVNAELDYLNKVIYTIAILALVIAIAGILLIEHRRVANELALARSEKKYRLLFERAGDAIFLVGIDGAERGTIISANQAAMEMYGYTAGKLEGRKFSDLVARNSRARMNEQLEQILSGTWLHGETAQRRKDGTGIPVEYSAGLLDLETKRYLLIINRDISERKTADNALSQVTKKLSLLNSVTFNEIQNAFFSLNGYITLGKTFPDHERILMVLDKAGESLKKIEEGLDFAKNYQDLGVKPPQWQDVTRTFALGISHLNFSSVKRTIRTDGLEIYADPLLERVFFTLANNVLQHASGATEVALRYEVRGESLLLFFEDNGPGIPEKIKEKIFLRGFGSQKDMELFLIREILSITGITIRETGEPGTGARFEIMVPKGAWRQVNRE